MAKITPDDVKEWKYNEITQAYFQGIKNQIEATKTAISEGSCLDLDSVEATALKVARLTGYIAGLQDAINVSEKEVITV